MHAVIAAELLAHTLPDVPATEEALAPGCLAVLEAMHPRPKNGWTNATLLSAIARISSHQARNNDGPPGWLSLWRGYQKLNFMAESYLIAIGQKSYK